TGSALLLVFLAFAVTSVLSHADDEKKQLISLADVIGINSVNALLFVDQKQAEQTLAALAVKDDIVQAALFDGDGRLFARSSAASDSSSPPGPLSPEQMGGTLITRLGRVLLYRPVRINQYVIGVVMIEGRQNQMWLDIVNNLGITFVATLVSLAIAL